jgi:hypothetical protein
MAISSDAFAQYFPFRIMLDSCGVVIREMSFSIGRTWGEVSDRMRSDGGIGMALQAVALAAKTRKPPFLLYSPAASSALPYRQMWMSATAASGAKRT